MSPDHWLPTRAWDSGTDQGSSNSVVQLRPITKSVKESRKLPALARSLPLRRGLVDDQVRDTVHDRVQPVTAHALEAAFVRALLDQGARPWQAEILAPMLVAAFEQFPNA